MPSFDPATTALVLIDLQEGIVGSDLAPRSGQEVVATAKDLAARFRAAGAPVVLIHVGWRGDGSDWPSQTVDKPSIPDGGPAEGWSTLVGGLKQSDDTVILKHHWGAFTGTELDLRLRRMNIRTIVLAGIATNFGVESTARSAWELSYDVVVVEDATTSRSADLHRFAIENILPRISRIVTADDIALEAI